MSGSPQGTLEQFFVSKVEEYNFVEDADISNDSDE